MRAVGLGGIKAGFQMKDDHFGVTRRDDFTLSYWDVIDICYGMLCHNVPRIACFAAFIGPGNSERQLVELINYNPLYRWFVGLTIYDVWVHSTFSINQDRLLENDVIGELWEQGYRQNPTDEGARFAKSERGIYDEDDILEPDANAGVTEVIRLEDG